MYKTKSTAYRKQRAKASLCFTSNYVFKCCASWAGKAEMEERESVLGPSAIIMGLLTSPCLWVMLLVGDFWPFSADAWRGGFIMAPVKRVQSVRTSPLLIRKQRCVRSCRSSPIHMCSFKASTYAIIPFPPLSLSEPVCRSGGWEHDGRQGQLFSSRSKSHAGWPVCRRVALCQKVLFTCCLQTA